MQIVCPDHGRPSSSLRRHLPLPVKLALEHWLASWPSFRLRRQPKQAALQKRWLALLVAVWCMLPACDARQVEGARGVGREGDACTGEGTYACDLDEPQELICLGGSFVVSRICPGGCELEADGEELALTCLNDSGDPY